MFIDYLPCTKQYPKQSVQISSLNAHSNLKIL